MASWLATIEKIFDKLYFDATEDIELILSENFNSLVYRIFDL